MTLFTAAAGPLKLADAARFDTFFTIVIRSFAGGPTSNQMEDANTNVRCWSSSQDSLMYNQIEDE